MRQYDLLLRCSSARLVWGFRVSAFAFFYSGGALLDSRVRNHARVQDRSSFGNSPFKSKFCCLGFGTSLLLRKNSCMLSCLTAFCIIRGCPSVCMCVSCCRFALFIRLLAFLHSSDPLQTYPEIREYLVQKLHRVK